MCFEPLAKRCRRVEYLVVVPGVGVGVRAVGRGGTRLASRKPLAVCPGAFVVVVVVGGGAVVRVVVLQGLEMMPVALALPLSTGSASSSSAY